MTVTDYLTVEQAAHLLQVHPETVRRMLRERRLAGARLGGRRAGWRIPAGAVERLLAEGLMTAPPPSPAPAADVGSAETYVRAPQERHARMLAQLVGQAERAAAAGDHDAVARIAATLAGLEVER